MKAKMTILTASLLAMATLFISGCAQPVVTTNADGSKATNYVANTTATTMANGAEMAAPLVPQPWGGVVGAVGLLVGAVASGIAIKKNAQANLHQTTLQSVVSGIESSLPAVTSAITDSMPAASTSPTATQALTTANAALGAVKAAISSATTASGTAANLNAVAATVGAGPSAA